MMYAVTLYGREVVVRSRVWFGPFHSWMYEVCDVSGGEPYTPIAVFDCVDDVWKYINSNKCRKLFLQADTLKILHHQMQVS